MKQIFQYDTYKYEYYIEFGERKSLTLVVRPDLRIIVRVPLNATLDEIEAFLTRKWRWLEKRLAEFRKYQKTHRDKQYVSGEAFHYLGKQYTLEATASSEDTVKLERGKLRLFTTKGLRNSKHNQLLIEEWFARRRHEVFKRQYIRAIKLFDFEKVPQLRERIMSHRWGSYSADHKIHLNPRLIEVPAEAIYYVCIHELCHVTNKRHDDAFYKELHKRMPEWRKVKEHLEVNYG